MSNILKKDTEKDVLNNTPGSFATVCCSQVSQLCSQLLVEAGRWYRPVSCATFMPAT